MVDKISLFYDHDDQMIATSIDTIIAQWPLVIITIEDKCSSICSIYIMIICKRSGKSAMKIW